MQVGIETPDRSGPTFVYVCFTEPQQVNYIYKYANQLIESEVLETVEIAARVLDGVLDGLRHQSILRR